MQNGKTTPIGIDLGTTYSCVAAWSDVRKRVEIITNEQGYSITPSCVAFTDTEILVGDGAKNQITRNLTNTVIDVKRMMGARFSDIKLQKDMQSWPFKVVEGSSDKPIIVLEHEGIEKKFSPEEISSLILRKLKKAAEEFLGTKVVDAVITIPAYFDDKQRQATKEAGRLAGLNVMRLISEPTAAAIAYGLDNHTGSNQPEHKNVFIFDLGGGTFDVSLLTISRKGTITVKAVGGDTHLGGQDFDNVMVDHCVQEFMKKHKKDMSNDARAMGRLKVECEKAKRDLSSTAQTTIIVDCLHGGIDFSMKITRAKFEGLNLEFFKKCIEHVDNCLKDGNIHKNNVDVVVLVGGSAKIPKMQQMLGDFFDYKIFYKSINADEAVAYGAAVLAATLRNQGTNTMKDIILLDVTPLSLGTNILAIKKNQGKTMSVIIPRNTPIPTSKVESYWTAVDNQEAVGVEVYQGESDYVKDNRFLNEFTLYGLPPRRAGKEEVRICFSMDANGILDVSAESTSTKNRRSMVIADSGNLTNEEIENMLKKVGL